MVHELEQAMIPHYEPPTMKLEDMWLKPHIDRDNGVIARIFWRINSAIKWTCGPLLLRLWSSYSEVILNR